MKNGGLDLLNLKVKIHSLQSIGQDGKKQMMMMMTIKMPQVDSELVVWVISIQVK